MKNIFVIFRLCCIGTLFFLIPIIAQGACDPAPAGLVSWWAAEGNAYDQISGNNGTLVGGVSYGSGEVGQGFVLNGNGQGVSVAGGTNLWLQNLTIETWVKRASPSVVSYGSGGNGVIFGYGSSGGNAGYYLFYMDSLGELRLSQNGNSVYLTGPAITDTGFHHVALTKTGGTVVFYVDGVAYPAPAFNTTFTFSDPAGIGYRPDNGDNSFYGVIDELSIYNRALSQSEIQGIYNAGSGGKCFTPVAPTITSEPTNEIVLVGQPASFSVLALGTPPLSYQWNFNTTNIMGATNATLMLTSVQLTNAGNYAVLVSNAVSSVLSSNAVLTVNSLPCDLPPAGLVSWWAAEGNAYDQISGNNGTLVGGVSYGSGEVGQGFVLNGNGQGVSVAGGTNLWLQNLTIETWVKRASPSVVSYGSGGNGVIFGYGSSGGNAGYYLFYMDSLGELRLSQNGNSVYLTGPAITDTGFHHVALTKTGGTVVFYVDGVAYPAPAFNTTFTFSDPAGIGYRPDNGDNSFYGVIDELSIYNRALSQSEIQGIYNAGSGGKCFTPVAPTITSEPTNEIVLVGQPASFSILAVGTPPFSYQWQLAGTNLPAGTNYFLTLTNPSSSQSGNYDVVVTNYVGSVTSNPAMLDVRFILVSVNGQPAASNMTEVASGTVTITGGYPAGFLFYTLDGSIPTTSSMFYGGAFTLTSSAVVSVMGLSADFTQTAYAGPIKVQIIPVYDLKTSVMGSGSVSVNPATGPYASNSVVTLTATAAQHWAFDHWTGGATGSQNPLDVTLNGPLAVQAVFVPTAYPLTVSSPGGGSITVNGFPNSPGTYYPTGSVVVLAATASNGWSFVGWQGSASSTSNPFNLMINQTNNVQAIFGTIVGTNAVGGGNIFLGQPNPVPYGTQLSVSAVPNSGKYFVTWSGGAATGTKAPTAFSVTNANPTVNALFASLPSGEFSLSVVVIGNGSIVTTPQQNYYDPGDIVTLQAVPIGGTDFYGWSQDASGTNNPLFVTMNTNKIMMAYCVASQPTNQTVFVGNTAIFSITPVGSIPLSYQWQFGGTNITGSTNTTLILSNVFPIVAGNYAVAITSAYGSVTSNPALLIVVRPGMTSPAIPASGQFQFSFASATGVNYEVQYSTNLTKWLPMETLSGTGGPLTFIDTNTPAGPQGFYRMVLSPR